MEREDIKFMRSAINQAKLALSERELPVGAIIVMNGKIIAKGRRSVKGNTRLDHAEMEVLREALSNHEWADEMILYTTLEPCIMCFGAVLNTRVKKVVYALEDPYGGAAHLKPTFMPERHKIKFPQVVKGVLREEARELFKEFFRTTNSDFWKNHPENPLVKICSG